jgi:hypothetical protein
MMFTIGLAVAGFTIAVMVFVVLPAMIKRLGRDQYAPTKARRSRRNRGFDLTLDEARPGPREPGDPML